MSTLYIVHFLLGIFLILLGTYAIFHEKELVRFERKVWKYIKAFFKALYYTIKDKVVK